VEETVKKHKGKRWRVQEDGFEADSHVKLKAESRAGGVTMVAQSNITQPATSTMSPAELRDLVMAAPPS
jgi:hypothetical protein